MKVAIIADIHGNSIALNNVLNDIQSQGGVDETWFLGDYAAIGFDPIGVLESITSLPNTRFLRGNTDRYVESGDMPWPEIADIKKEPELAQLHIQVARSFSWTTGAVGATGWLPWFRELKLDFRVNLLDGSKVLAVHASPGTDDGMGININTSYHELRQLVSDAGANLIFVAHTHIPFDRSVQGIRVVNPGSVSNPFPPDLRASYGLLEVDKSGHTITHRRVDYDRNAVVKAMSGLNHPSAEYVKKFMSGNVRKDWMK